MSGDVLVKCLILFPELMAEFLLAQERSKHKADRENICWMKDRSAKKEIAFSSSRQALQMQEKNILN